MNSEAGPSTAPSQSPLFKKRGKSHTTSRISTAVIDDPQPSTTAATTTTTDSADSANATTQQEEDEISVQDLIALRSLMRKPTGIELERLNNGDRKKKKQQKEKSVAQHEEERWEQQMKSGGLMAVSATAAGDDEESEEEDGSKARRLVRKNNFQGETGTVDVDKHMMAYIEEEMKKRNATTNPSSSSSSSSNLDQTALVSAVNNPEDALYALAEKYKELSRSIRPEQTQEEREGNVALSAAMLSSIPEVDLGIDTRMKNIQDTERAKRQFYETKRNKDANGDASVDEAFANARFQRQRPRANNSDFHHRPSNAAQQNGGYDGTNRGEKKQLATDQLVLDRFKKRQRNFR
ncbi:uncharacterized protein UTRI_06067 [Ustilago trichophora]|uniref:Hepatocellular carcinoma-associated antigen 59-domain-containing protein n=1 Tax=Ustilago trichophora TaxID=86804 RepID=A0A5C3EF59_9BASI|nr:uncharacterized protein UTRI_06067 [Ustilago trichophora]